MSLLTEILHKTHFENWSGEELASINPATGKELGHVRLADEEDYDDVMWDAVKSFERWRLEPAPKRGERRAGVAGDARNGEDSCRGARRGAGDDRYRDLRRRPLAPALRPLNA